MDSKEISSPALDADHHRRNPKTAWLEFKDQLTSWLWAHKDGQSRWTLEMDEALRRASALHPPTTVAGLHKQALHQSILKNALVKAYGRHYPAIISQHPNTDARDAAGHVVPFGTQLLIALGEEIVPADADGISQATLEFESDETKRLKCLCTLRFLEFTKSTIVWI